MLKPIVATLVAFLPLIGADPKPAADVPKQTSGDKLAEQITDAEQLEYVELLNRTNYADAALARKKQEAAEAEIQHGKERGEINTAFVALMKKLKDRNGCLVKPSDKKAMRLTCDEPQMATPAAAAVAKDKK